MFTFLLSFKEMPDTVVYGKHSLVNFKFQAKRTDGTDEAGIIPSQICEER